MEILIKFFVKGQKMLTVKNDLGLEFLRVKKFLKIGKF